MRKSTKRKINRALDRHNFERYLQRLRRRARACMIKLNLAARDYVVREILATIKDDEGGVSFEAPSPHAEYINAILKRIREGCGLTKEDLEHE